MKIPGSEITMSNAPEVMNLGAKAVSEGDGVFDFAGFPTRIPLPSQRCCDGNGSAKKAMSPLRSAIFPPASAISVCCTVSRIFWDRTLPAAHVIPLDPGQGPSRVMIYGNCPKL